MNYPPETEAPPFCAEQILKRETIRRAAEVIHIKEPSGVQKGSAHSAENCLPKCDLLALPSDHLEVSFVFTSDHLVTGNRFYNFKFSTERFLKRNRSRANDRFVGGRILTQPRTVREYRFKHRGSRRR